MVSLTLVPADDEPYPESFRTNTQHKEDNRSVIFRPNCALDGEGITKEPKHYYRELNAVWSKGKRIIRGDDLSGHEIFDFLFRLSPRLNLLVYGASYDFNMWMQHLPFQNLVEVTTTNITYWGPYKIKWVQGKYFYIQRIATKEFRIVYDVIAWFQKKFEITLADWSIGTSEERAFISTMKSQRNNLAALDPQEVERYCWLECELLLQLVDKLCQAIQQTPYRPRALYGPGALAQAIFDYHNIKSYMGPYDEPKALMAYYGGRFDTALFGWFDNVHEYDIRSAYPDQIRNLPCLAHGQWVDCKDPFKYPHGIYRVKWDVGIDCLYPPFPYRDSTGCIWYLYAGQGWYHADEVRAAIEVFGNKSIRVLEGIAWDQQCDHQPFDFVEKLYKWRLQIAKENYPKGQIVKLSLNSMYGKLVQSVGSKNSPPPYQNFFWGGAITAGVRAKNLRTIAPHMDKIISIATDGIVSLETLEVTIGTQLGEWEYSELLQHIQLSNGVYHSIDKKTGKAKERARGIGHGEMNWRDIETIYREHGIAGKYSYRRKDHFYTIKEALHLNRPDLMCTWQRNEERHLDFTPTRMEVTGLNLEGKEPPFSDDDLLQFRGARYSTADLVDMNHKIPTKTTLSYPFRKKRSWEEQLELRDYYLQRGQPTDDLY